MPTHREVATNNRGVSRGAARDGQGHVGSAKAIALANKANIWLWSSTAQFLEGRIHKDQPDGRSNAVAHSIALRDSEV